MFVFDQIKKDWEVFRKQILTKKPDLILGVAKGGKYSRIEPIAINKFGKLGRVEKDGPEEVKLWIPEGNMMKVSQEPSRSFCNWTMYKIARLIETEKLPTRLSFTHLGKDGLKQLGFNKVSSVDFGFLGAK